MSSLSDQKTTKAYSPDSILPIVLKTCAPQFAPCLGKLSFLPINFNLSLFLKACISRKGTPRIPLTIVQLL